jgi:integrase
VPVVSFAYLTGWRKAEVLGLEWNRVDFDEGTVSLNPGETKSGEGRTIYMTTELRELLEAQDAARLALQKKGVICPFVFNRFNGKPVKDYYTAWRKATKAAGCPGRILHDMRRTAIRRFTRSGIAEATAMRLSGHKTRSVFDRYDIGSTADLKHAAALLDGVTVRRTGTGSNREK